jgi:hypothetical protein
VNVPVSLVPRNVGYNPELKMDRNCLVDAYPLSLLFEILGVYILLCVLVHLARLLINRSPASHRYLTLLIMEYC